MKILEARNNLITITEILVEESKGHISSEDAIVKIRELMNCCDVIIPMLNNPRTNHDWVNSMDTETFAEWCCGDEVISNRTKHCLVNNSNGELKYSEIYLMEQPSPKLKTVLYGCTDSYSGLLDWLNKERIEE